MSTKILFIQQDAFQKMGIMSISACLKAEGHWCNLIIDDAEKNTMDSICAYGPGLVAFSITTGQEKWALELASKIKTILDVPIVFGGPHVTFNPDIIAEPPVDFICQGEGEDAAVELVYALEKDLDVTNIKNIGAKINDKIYKNPLRPLEANLDRFPFLDRDIYNRYKFFREYYREMAPFMSWRGCPYNCTYCFNKKFIELYETTPKKYLRGRSVANVIEEMEQLKERYGVTKIDLLDDTFMLDKSWLFEFCEAFQDKIKLPFICNTYAQLVDEKSIKALTKAGCIHVKMGVESGNEELRRKILNKKVSNAQFIKAANIIKAHGITLQTYNMVGIPGENLNTALETFILNRKMRADFASCSILQPYPGTDIGKYTIENKLIEGIDEQGMAKNHNGLVVDSFYVGSTIKFDDKKEVTNLQRLFQFSIAFRIPLFILKLLIKLPKNRFFDAIFRFMYAYSIRKYNRVNYISFLKLGWKTRSYMTSQKRKEAGKLSYKIKRADLPSFNKAA